MAGGPPPPTTGPPIPPSPIQRKTPKASKVAMQLAAANAAARDESGQRMKRNTNTRDVCTQYRAADGSDRFRCNRCLKSFNLRCTVLRHVRQQHEGRFVPHPCPECGQVFKRTDHLKVHRKKIHQIDTISSRTYARKAAAAAAAAAAEATGGAGKDVSGDVDGLSLGEVEADDEEGMVDSPSMVIVSSECVEGGEEEEEEEEEEVDEEVEEDAATVTVTPATPTKRTA